MYNKLTYILPLVALAFLLGIPITSSAQCVQCKPFKNDILVCSSTTAGVIICLSDGKNCTISGVCTGKKGTLERRRGLVTNDLLLRVQPASTGMISERTLKLEPVEVKQIATQDPMLAATLHSLSQTGVSEWGQVSWIPLRFTSELVAEWVDSGQKFKDFYEANQGRFAVDRTKSMIRFTYVAEATADPDVLKVTISQEAIAKSTRRK
jgi:hypothetical protein